jgi:hypothetical protein
MRGKIVKHLVWALTRDTTVINQHFKKIFLSYGHHTIRDKMFATNGVHFRGALLRNVHVYIPVECINMATSSNNKLVPSGPLPQLFTLPHILSTNNF